MLREGRGGGRRVSCATLEAAADPVAIATAEQAMRSIAQTPLFRLGDRPEEQILDAELDRRGYALHDETVILAGSSDAVAGDPLPPMTGFPVWPPLHIQRQIWLDAGIGPKRLAVMDRAGEPRATFLGRHNDRVAGTAFVACHDDIAMLHTLEVPPTQRREGVGRLIMRAAAHWAVAQGAGRLAVAVTRANDPALALYGSLGMAEVGRYHYRQSPE